MDYKAYLQSLESLIEVEEKDIDWLLEKGEIIQAKQGDYIFRKGELASFMTIIIKGEMEIYLLNDNQKRYLSTVKSGSISGILPYSRMKEASGFGQFVTEGEYLRLDKSFFDELIKEHHSLTAALVHSMTTRVRNFTSFQKQNEKLMALGKLSAGLAHELNNPASAILRSAESLLKGFDGQPKNFKEVITLTIDEKTVDIISQLVMDKKNQGVIDLPMMEKSEKEDEWADWLEEKGTDEPFTMAETFVDFGIELEEVQEYLNPLDKRHSATVLTWMENVLNTEKIVKEIQEASKRISTLIQSVKTYTHMDRGADRERTDIKSGIISTITMLQHKIRKKGIELDKSFDENLPPINAVIGELNQIWTNIIDNAIDAVPENGGKISIRSYEERNNVKVDIQDNGEGIDSTVLEKIFDPFFTTKKVGEGTGLGLDIVKKIIDQHQGSINVISEKGKTVFTICFPKAN